MSERQRLEEAGNGYCSGSRKRVYIGIDPHPGKFRCPDCGALLGTVYGGRLRNHKPWQRPNR
jgi:hypothetical protein